MRRRLAALLALALLAACATTRPAPPDPQPSAPGVPGAAPIFLWKVSPADGTPGTLYLQGAVHLDRGPGPRIDRAALAALEGADEAVVEIEPTPEMLRRIAELMQEKGLLPPGESLSGQLSPELGTLLDARCEKLGLPPALFQKMRPWLAALTLPVLELKLDGFRDDAGVDRFVAERARELGKPVRSLETADFQIELFAGLPPLMQERLLRDGLRESALGPELKAVFEAWRAGDVAALEAAVFVGMKEHPEYAELYERMYFARNRTMAEALREMLAEGQSFFVSVGAGHLVGDRGLVSLLEKAGYRVERVAPLGVAEELLRAEKPWVPVIDDARGLRFELPAAPLVQEEANAQVYILDQTTLALAVTVVPTPPMPKGFDPKPLIDAIAQNVVGSQPGGVVESSEEVFFAGATVRHVRFTFTGGRGEHYVFARNHALFVLAAVQIGKATGEDSRPATAKRFFDGFSFMPAAAPQP